MGSHLSSAHCHLTLHGHGQMVRESCLPRLHHEPPGGILPTTCGLRLPNLSIAPLPTGPHPLGYPPRSLRLPVRGLVPTGPIRERCVRLIIRLIGITPTFRCHARLLRAGQLIESRRCWRVDVDTRCSCRPPPLLSWRRPFVTSRRRGGDFAADFGISHVLSTSGLPHRAPHAPWLCRRGCSRRGCVPPQRHGLIHRSVPLEPSLGRGVRERDGFLCQSQSPSSTGRVGCLERPTASLPPTGPGSAVRWTTLSLPVDGPAYLDTGVYSTQYIRLDVFLVL